MPHSSTRLQRAPSPSACGYPHSSFACERTHSLPPPLDAAPVTPGMKFSSKRPLKAAQSPRRALEDAVHKELQAMGDKEDLFLRSTSELSALLRNLSFEHGRAYFRYVLRDVFGEASTIYASTATPPTPTEIAIYTQSIIKRLARAIHYAPPLLRACTKFTLQEFQKIFPESARAEQIVVGSMLFLRVLCPAVINPETLGFAPHTASSRIIGIQIAKLLQSTVRNGSSSKGAEDPVLAQFVALHHPIVATFLAVFPQLQCDADDMRIPEQQPTVCHMNRAASWDVARMTPRTQLPSAMSWHGDTNTAPAATTDRHRGVSISRMSQRLHRKFSFKFWQ